MSLGKTRTADDIRRSSEPGGQKCSTQKSFHKMINYTTELGIYNTYTEPSLVPITSKILPLECETTKVISTTSHLKLTPSASIRRPKRTSSPNTNQSPEPNSPSSDQPSRSLALADANHALGILGLGLALRVHDAVDRATNAKIRRWFDDERQVACGFAEVVDLRAADDGL